MERDSRRMRGERPFLFSNLKAQEGVGEIVGFVLTSGGFATQEPTATIPTRHPIEKNF